MKYYVYLLMYPNGTPFYVGKGQNRRLQEHFTKSSRKKVNFKNNVISSIEKSGGQVKSEIIFYSDCQDTVNNVEISLISFYGRRGLDAEGILTNRTLGGDGGLGFVLSQSTKKKHSDNSRVFKNGSITDYTFWLKADAAFLLYRDFPKAKRNTLCRLLGLPINKSKPLESMVCAFDKGWNPLEDKEYLAFKSERGESLITSLVYNPSLIKTYVNKSANVKLAYTYKGKTFIFLDDFLRFFKMSENMYRKLRKAGDIKTCSVFDYIPKQIGFNYATPIK